MSVPEVKLSRREHRDLQERERKVRDSLRNESLRIRQSAQFASEHVWKSLESAHSFRGSISHRITHGSSLGSSSSVASSASIETMTSKERAIRRGKRRGSREINEANDILRDVIADSEFVVDFGTVMSETTEGENINGLGHSPDLKSRDRNRAPLKISQKRSLKTSSLSNASSTEPCDAWMCGVCGQAFATLSSANRHETKHIEQVVKGICAASIPPSTRNDLSVPPIYRSRSETPSNHAPHSTSGDSTAVDASDPVVNSTTAEPEQSRGLPVVNKLRDRTNSEVRFEDQLHGVHGTVDDIDEPPLLLPSTVIKPVILADEALLTVCQRAEHLILCSEEIQAEHELALLARDKKYYDDMADRALSRRVNPMSRYRSDAEGLVGKVHNKLLDAYQLMKEADEGGPRTGLTSTDLYNKKKRKNKDGVIGDLDDQIVHTSKTLYVNVMVRNSVQVVKYELQRLAGQRWENAEESGKNLDQFERFRIYAHLNIVKLAGIALASDFTPRRVAVQQSNDLYRLLSPKLKRRGVTIESEIEYRVGPYFVLSVNIQAVDWRRLIKAARRDLILRTSLWNRDMMPADSMNNEKPPGEGLLAQLWNYWKRARNMPVNDILEHVFAWLYHLHWTIYLPICYILYHVLIGTWTRKFILSSVTDDIFKYAEEKGMEMEIGIRCAKGQSAFMLNALREIRADGRALAKRRQESEKHEKGTVLGPLLGPAIKLDASSAIKPDGFEIPENLEYVSLELDIPVGFRRLRWAWLHVESKFIIEALYKTEAKYDDITVGKWDKHPDYIGAVSLPDSVNPEEFVGATKEGSYLMPRSAFVAANMCFETHYVVAYNDFCFCVKKRARNPDVPFGKTFLAWTQYVFINLGNNSCRMICSVEAEFPNGAPMVSRQIQSGMRAGTGDLFVLTGETISKYAAEYP